MKEYATKLVDVTEHHAEDIAKQWAKAVRTNPKTPSYRNVPEEKAIRQAVDFYKHFRQMFFAENSYEAARNFIGSFAEARFREGIPPSEAVYALTLMRRHMWLYADFQALFITAHERQQAVEILNRTILMFDYVVYAMNETYHNLIKQEIDKQLGAVKALMMSTEASKRKTDVTKAVVTAILLAGCIFVTYYCHAVLKTEVIFTHLFYIPIIMASIWWRKKGIVVALLLGVVLIISHLMFFGPFPIFDNLVRAAMFLIIGTVVALLTEGIETAEAIYRQQSM